MSTLTPEEEGEEEQVRAEFYGLALKDFEAAKNDQTRAEALSDLVCYAPDPQLTLAYAHQLEALTAGSKDNEELFFSALVVRFETRMKLAEEDSNWEPARQAAQQYHDQASTRQAPASEKLRSILALAKVEAATANFPVAQQRIDEAEDLAKSIPYPKDDPADLEEVGDAIAILEAHAALARSRGELDKVALLESQLKVLNEDLKKRIDIFLAQSQVRIETITKKVRRQGYLFQTLAVVVLLLVFAKPLLKMIMAQLQ